MQTVLLQKNWFDLFALGMSQWSKTISSASLLANINSKFDTYVNNGKLSEKKTTVLREQLVHLNTFISECDTLEISHTEYAYLKLICLLDSGRYFVLK